MKKLPILMAMISLLMMINGFAQGQKFSKLVWKPFTTMPAARSNAAVVTYGRKIYVIGGNDENSATNTFWRFNPKTKKWKAMPNMHTARFGHTAVAFGNKIYVFGGIQVIHGKLHYLRSAEVYNFWSKKWKTLHNMPYANARFGLTKWGDKIVMAGGMNSRHLALRGVELFDPTNQTWTRFKSLDIPRNRVSATVLNDRLYILGGADATDHALSSMAVYSGDLNHWQEVGAMYEPRKNFGLTQLGGKIYVTGGWRKSFGFTKFIESTEAYDPSLGLWKVVGELPQGKDGVRMASYAHRIYLFGGYNKIPSSVVEIGKIV